MNRIRIAERVLAGMATVAATVPAHASYITTTTTSGDMPVLGFLAISGLVLFALLCMLAIALLPAMIAFMRDHRNKWPILILTVVGSWTGIGWIAAFIWACLPREGIYIPSGGLDRIERLAAMRDAGRLTEDEYQHAKAEILKRM